MLVTKETDQILSFEDFWIWDIGNWAIDRRSKWQRRGSKKTWAEAMSEQSVRLGGE